MMMMLQKIQFSWVGFSPISTKARHISNAMEAGPINSQTIPRSLFVASIIDYLQPCEGWDFLFYLKNHLPPTAMIFD